MKKLSFVGWFLAGSSVVLALGSCQEEQLPATISGLPDGDITFQWNEKLTMTGLSRRRMNTISLRLQGHRAQTTL